MTVLTIPTLTYDELLRRAVEDWGAVTNIAYADNMSLAKAHCIAARAVTAAVEEWCFESGAPYEAVSWPLQVAVLDTVTKLGLDDHERHQQLDIFEDEDIWRGAAAHEARKELE